MFLEHHCFLNIFDLWLVESGYGVFMADWKDTDTGKCFILSSKVVCVQNLFFLGGLPFPIAAFT